MCVYVCMKYILFFSQDYPRHRRAPHPLAQSVETIHCADVRPVRYCRLAHPPNTTPAIAYTREGGLRISYVSRSIYPCHPRFTRAQDGIDWGRLYTTERSARSPAADKADNESRSSILFPRVSSCNPRKCFSRQRETINNEACFSCFARGFCVTLRRAPRSCLTLNAFGSLCSLPA